MAALDVVGDYWTLGVIRCAAFGFSRFSQFEAELGVASNLLSDRLSKLVETGVLDRSPYQSRPERHEYRLTRAGLELVPVVVALKVWGDRHNAGRDPTGTVRHRGCESSVAVVARCPDCGESVGPADLEVTPPGTGSDG